MPSKPSPVDKMRHDQALAQTVYAVVDTAGRLDEDEEFLLRLDTALVKFTTQWAEELHELGTRLGLIRLLWFTGKTLEYQIAPYAPLDLGEFRAARLASMPGRLSNGAQLVLAALDQARSIEEFVKSMQYPAGREPAAVTAMTVAAAIEVRAVMEAADSRQNSLWSLLGGLLGTVMASSR